MNNIDVKTYEMFLNGVKTVKTNLSFFKTFHIQPEGLNHLHLSGSKKSGKQRDMKVSIEWIEMNEKIKELLRHFWSTVPINNSEKLKKHTRMVKALEEQLALYASIDDSHGVQVKRIKYSYKVLEIYYERSRKSVNPSQKIGVIYERVISRIVKY
jgi:predicted transcriptional regulator